MATVKNEYGQYFTSPHVADLMISLIRAPKTAQVLEPCSGTGVFLDRLLLNSFENISAVEIDPNLANHPHVTVENNSFVTWTSKKRFDVVIGNPPYIRWKNLDAEAKNEIQGSPHWGTLFNSLTDYLSVFIVNAIELLKENGELIFITPSFWLHTQHSDRLRNYMVTNGYFSDLITFGEAQVFEGVSSSIIIFRYIKSKHEPSRIRLFTYEGNRRLNRNLSLGCSSEFRMSEIPAFKASKHWTLSTQEDQDSIEELELWTTKGDRNSLQLLGHEKVWTIGDICKIANGMVSGLDKAFRIPSEMTSHLNSLERRHILNVVKAFEIFPLFANSTTPYIDIPLNLTETEVESDFPNFYRHLLQFRDQLEKRYSYKRDLPFWEWAFRRSENFFLNGQRKIFVPCKERITNKRNVRFAIAPANAVATQDVTAFAPLEGVKESLEYIAAYLNLDEVSDWIRLKGLIKGGVAEFSERPLSAIPFRPIDWGNRSEVQLHKKIRDSVRAVEEGTGEAAISAAIRSSFVELGLPISPSKEQP